MEDIGRASGELAVHILPTPASPELMLDEGWKSKLRDSLVIHADQAALIRQLQLPETVTYIHTSVLLLAHDLYKAAINFAEGLDLRDQNRINTGAEEFARVNNLVWEEFLV